ncbi:hypothetical protein V5799_013214 [Amblyomma americanum]|uniref:Strictosidine synthase conserved region domain-containing protein n=1 Tax=Amblyomma americanum TaxID=6943 RepID=A0AAQ4E6J9_AMBAM
MQVDRSRAKYEEDYVSNKLQCVHYYLFMTTVRCASPPKRASAVRACGGAGVACVAPAVFCSVCYRGHGRRWLFAGAIPGELRDYFGLRSEEACIHTLRATPVSYEVKLPEFKGPLAQNQALDKVQYLYPNQFVGPESLEAHEGSIYTGVIGGQILRLTGTKVTPVVKFGKACEGPWDEGICGRPLGLRFDKQGRLYVADAYSGISIVDVTKGFVTPLVPAGIDLDGHPLTFVNDVVIDGDGNVFFTETSTKWPLNKIVYSVLEHENSGRVLMYDAKTKRTHILLEDLYCPNGIELGPDGDSIIIAELSMKRLLRYYYRGAHKGDLDVFADNLPGDPDNIRRTPRGGYWVAFASGRSSDKASVLDHLAPYPLVRKSVVRLLYLLGSALKYASTLYDWAPLKDVASRVNAHAFGANRPPRMRPGG